MVLGTFRDKPAGPGRRQQTLTDSEDEVEDGGGAGGDGKPLVGWVYVGSHNFTPSAWGTLSGSGFNPMLNVRAYLAAKDAPLLTWDHAALSMLLDYELRAGDPPPAAQSGGDRQRCVLGAPAAEVCRWARRTLGTSQPFYFLFACDSDGSPVVRSNQNLQLS